MSEQFKLFLSQLSETNATLDYFTDFGKIVGNVNKISIKLNQLNYLIGKENLDEAIQELFQENPKVFEVLESEKSTDLFGIFHCFTGDFQQAQHAIDLGMKLGIGGVATFKNGKIDQFLSQIDLKHIVLETDSPYLAPVPFRGKRNESSYLVNVVSKLSEIYNLSPDEIAEITTENSKIIFGI